MHPVHAMRAHRGSGGIATLILNVGTRWINGQPNAPVAFSLEKGILGPTDLERGWVQ
jgi:hypothetical protein